MGYKMVKGMSIAIVTVIAIASGVTGFLTGSLIGSQIIGKSILTGVSSHSQEQVKFALDEEGYYVFTKRPPPQGGWQSILEAPGIDLSVSDEIPVDRVTFLYGLIGTAKFRIDSPGLYNVYYAIYPKNPSERYVKLEYLQVLVFPEEAVSNNLVDPQKIIAWEIYRYEGSKPMKVSFYVDKPGNYIVAFGPAYGAIVTSKEYELGGRILGENIIKVKVVKVGDSGARGSLIATEMLDASIIKLGSYIVISLVPHNS